MKGASGREKDEKEKKKEKKIISKLDPNKAEYCQN